MNKLIPVFKPCIGEEEIKELRKIFKSGWIGLGPKTAEFEGKFAKYIGVKHAVGVNSATAALHLALAVLNVENKEVITTSMTFVSTNHAILYNKGIPVFADIEKDTLNIDPKEIEKKITPRTAAIMVVHYGGHACDMDAIMALAKKHNLKVVEDCAHGCGGQYKGKMLGSIGDIGCFSFHAVKNLTTGEGGMLTLNDDKQNTRLRKLRWLGITRDTWSRNLPNKGYSWFYDVEEIGFKCHMNDIPAVIGLVQLKKIDKMNNKRRLLHARYNAKLSGMKQLEIPVTKNYTNNACHNYVLKVEKRNDLIEFLKTRDISTGVHYIPNHMYDIYKPYSSKLPVTEGVWEKLITLPLYPDLTTKQQDKVIKAIKDFYSK